MEVSLGKKKDTLYGSIPKQGEQAPRFSGTDLNDQKISSDQYEGEVVLVNVFPDISTRVCSIQAGKFNDMVNDLENVRVVSISVNSKKEQQEWIKDKQINMDLLRDTERSFGKAFGVLMNEADKLARSVFVIDRDGEIVYSEILENQSNEPDYDQAAGAARQAASIIA